MRTQAIAPTASWTSLGLLIKNQSLYANQQAINGASAMNLILVMPEMSERARFLFVAKDKRLAWTMPN